MRDERGEAGNLSAGGVHCPNPTLRVTHWMGGSPQLPGGWIPVKKPYTGNDATLQALQQLRNNVESVNSSAEGKGPDNPLFAGVDKSELDPLSIRPDEAPWQPGANKKSQRDYITLCMNMRVLKLVAGGKSYDTQLGEWLLEEYRLKSTGTDTLQIQSEEALDGM